VEESVYEVDARAEQEHWWYVGRRKLFGSIIGDLGVRPGDPILDVGTSAGTNLRMLRDLGFSNFVGLDASAAAIRWCAKKGLGTVRLGDVVAMPFDDDTFSLVLATDIIEHVDDDLRALREVKRVLAPGGPALITVPAFPSLWGLQDEVSHHKRRYLEPELLRRIGDAGLEVERSFHFNYLLFGPIWVARQVFKVFRPSSLKSEAQVNTPLMNRAFSILFDLDIATAPRLAPPFGASILVVARKPRRAVTA